MEKLIDSIPSSNNLNSVKRKTDRACDSTNELRGDRQFAAEFHSDIALETDFKNFKNPFERENPNAQNKNKEGMLLGSREDSLEIEDGK